MNDYVALGARTSAGLLAALYFGFTVAVMPALHGLGDAAFVDTMKRINVSIVTRSSSWFSSPLPCWPFAAAVLLRSPLVYTAAVLGIITLVITVVVNVPLNDTLATGGSRADFENLWVLFNALRTLTGIGSFLCLLLSPSTVH